MEKVAVTGHSGFIGTHLVEELNLRGFDVVKIGRDYSPTKCNRIYHLACPSTTEAISKDPNAIMDTILDGTRQALNICPTAMFINASSIGASYISLDQSPQLSYNIAKRCMEVYLENCEVELYNYRIPSVYGEGMHDDNFIKRCIDGRAFAPTNPDEEYFIAHVSDVVDALITLTPIKIEKTTLGTIYEHFSTGRRRLHRSTPSS